MKVNKSVEQGIYVLCILALQRGHTPVKSSVLSELLEVSDSYLKKLLAKLVKAGLICSEASRSGGYTLGKDVHEITVYDVFKILDLEGEVVPLNHLSRHIFDDQKHTKESEEKILAAFDRGFAALNQELQKLSIADLLDEQYLEDGYKDWNQTHSK